MRMCRFKFSPCAQLEALYIDHVVYRRNVFK